MHGVTAFYKQSCLLRTQIRKRRDIKPAVITLLPVMSGFSSKRLSTPNLNINNDSLRFRQFNSDTDYAITIPKTALFNFQLLKHRQQQIRHVGFFGHYYMPIPFQSA